MGDRIKNALKRDTVMLVVDAPSTVDIKFDISRSYKKTSVKVIEVLRWFSEQGLFKDAIEKGLCLPISTPELCAQNKNILMNSNFRLESSYDFIQFDKYALEIQIVRGSKDLE